MKCKLFRNTADFMAIDRGDEILLGEKRYVVTGHERERRFGMEDPKFWVKTAIEKDTGEKKILKLSFFESFETSLGGIKIRRFRNPEKEGDILGAVKDHPSFMHGDVFRDDQGNNVRVLDIVHGPNFFVYIDSIDMDHNTYFHKILPGILNQLVKAFEAIRFLHIYGFKHGDIRNDHIIVEKETGNYVWIDFDYDYETGENPFGLDIFGLGNILLYAIGKGFHTLHTIKQSKPPYGNLAEQIQPDDFSILNRSRFMNLQKIYLYIPRTMNDILMHFSSGADVYYEFADEVIEDLNRCIYSIR